MAQPSPRLCAFWRPFCDGPLIIDVKGSLLQEDGRQREIARGARAHPRQPREAHMGDAGAPPFSLLRRLPSCIAAPAPQRERACVHEDLGLGSLRAGEGWAARVRLADGAGAATDAQERAALICHWSRHHCHFALVRVHACVRPSVRPLHA